MATVTINGIQLDRLQQTINQVQKKPELAKFNFKTTNRWVYGTHNQAIVQDFFGAGVEDHTRTSPLVFEEDEPPVLLGNNEGANPVEFVLVALSGCLTTSLIAHAAAQGLSLKSVESQLEGNLDIRGFLGLSDEVRNGYEDIRVTFRIESDEPEEKIQELVALAQKRSPVFDIVTNKVPVTVDFSLEK